MNKPLSLILTLGLALGAAAAGAADKERPVDERRPLKADARVEVSNVAGDITVEAWDRNELHLTGLLSEQVEKLEITGNESRLKIEVKLPKRTRNVDDTILHLKVPAGIALVATGVSADIDVRGIRGDVEASTVSGDIELDVGSKNVEARSVSGEVTVRAPSAMTRVESVSGDIIVHGVRGEVRGETVSGDVEVRAQAARRVQIKSVSGDLEVHADLTADAEVEAKTMSGDVRLNVPQLPDVEIDLETYSGEIAPSELLPGLRRGKRHSRDDDDDEHEGREYTREGKGPGRVRLHSFSGDIVVRKK
ncbi:MAG: DUF4097 family beta strand repeat-containing protein [Nevskiaceae bacterium]